MKYGLQEGPSENDDKGNVSENTKNENVEKPAVSTKTTENQEDKSISLSSKQAASDVTEAASAVTETNENTESDIATQLKVNEPIDSIPSTSNAVLEKRVFSDIQTRSTEPDDNSNEAEPPTKIAKLCEASTITLSNTNFVVPDDKIKEGEPPKKIVKLCETDAKIPECSFGVGKISQGIMKFIISNDEQEAEMISNPATPVEMISKPTTPVEMISRPATPTDIDMGGLGDGQYQYIQPSVKYNFKNAPIIELSRYSWGANKQKYLRGCLFSPDGSCILTTVNKDGMHIIELPMSLYDNESVSEDRPLDVLTTAVHVQFMSIFFLFQF